MSTTEQLNVRIDSELKRKGTEALASIGLTPTEAVRRLWGLAAERGEGLEKVKGLFDDEEARNSGPVTKLEDGWKIMDEALKRLGLDKAAPLNLTDEELMELSYRDRGLL